MNDISINKQKIRRIDIDLLRFYGIVLMILGHVGWGRVFDKYIHAFHMPIWFMISGFFLTKEKNIAGFFENKIRTLLVPYLFWGIISELLLTLTIKSGVWYDGIIWPNVIANGAQWFLPALMIASSIGFVLLKYFPFWFSVIISMIIGIFGTMNTIRLPLAIDSALVGVGFFAIGAVLHKMEFKILSIKLPFLFVLIISNLFLVFLNGSVNMRTNDYSNILLFWINAVGSMVILLNVANIIIKKFRIPNVILEIGSESLIYPCVNHVMITYMNYYFTSDNLIVILTYKLLQFIFVMGMCFLINRLMRDSMLRFAVGRK